MASASPRQQQQQAVKAVASSCPTSPLQSGNNSKPDRTADFAAVRNLAESYGVALLPLEMGFTPLRTQRPKSAAAARLSTADSTTEHPNTPEVGENVAAAAAGRGLDQAYSASSTTGQHDTNDPSAARLLSPSKAGAAAPQPLQAAGGSGEAVGCFPIDVEEGSELNTESPSGMADFAEAGDGEGLYLYEDQLPMEERVTLLEEERDLLVDKLLATTEALHASEARNRQSEASQGQVHALLEQLQELLRRAEVERDRAKMQLKRHRASSNSQFVFPPVVLGSHPLSQGGIEALQSGPFALGSLGGAASSGGHDGLEAGLAARPRSKKYKVSRGGRAAGAGAGSIAGAAAAPAGDDAGAGSESAAGSEEDGAQAAAGAGSADGSSTAASAAVPGADAPAAGQAREHGGDSSVAAEGPWGSRRGSNASSCDSSDAVSPSVSPEPVVTLTPSTDEARPPVSSVVRGFEALLHRQRGAKGSPAGSSAGGQRSRELTLSARSSGSGGSRSASPMASRGGAGNPAALMAAAAPAGDKDGAVAVVLTAGEEGLPAEAAVAAAVPASPAGTADGSEQQGLSPSASEVFRRTYADAAVAGAEAERSRRSTAGIRPRAPLGAGSSSSATSTPTAAALCNAAPVGSYMLDSSVFSEEEELLASAGGAAPLSAGQEGTPSSGQGVYNPSRYTPARSVEPGSTGGAAGEWQSAGKRGRGSSSSLSSSPAVTPTAQQQQQVGGRSSPGSAFGSMISVTADSPAGSVTQSCAGAAAPSPVGAYSSSSSGGNGAGSTKGKARSASRLGMLQSPTATAPVDLSPKPVAATSSKQQQQAQKGRKAQQQGNGSGVSKTSSSSTSSGGARRQSPRQSVDGTAEVGVTAAGATAQAHKSLGSGAAAARGKQGAYKATPVTQQPPAARTASNGSATTSSNSSSSMLLVAVVLLLSVVAVAVYFWSQYRLAAMQAQVQQLQKQLSQRSVECPSGVGGMADGFDG